MSVSSDMVVAEGDNATYNFVLNYTGMGNIPIPEGLPRRAEVDTMNLNIDGSTILQCRIESSCVKYQERISIIGSTPSRNDDIYNLTFALLNVTGSDNNTYTIEITATYTYTLSSNVMSAPSFTLRSTVGLAVTQGMCDWGSGCDSRYV